MKLELIRYCQYWKTFLAPEWFPGTMHSTVLFCFVLFACQTINSLGPRLSEAPPTHRWTYQSVDVVRWGPAFEVHQLQECGLSVLVTLANASAWCSPYYSQCTRWNLPCFPKFLAGWNDGICRWLFLLMLKLFLPDLDGFILCFITALSYLCMQVAWEIIDLV